ncbi:YfiT family bacillithiol transferase [Deinococcus sp. RM]|uniref:YfiT family bacillithiol transferase n=1 Tax=Deinococcus sp. RM TaxID=2316359 RepID=UPI000E6A14B5|nr:putative metal-dependent hydrolase [Deinococcus sp. RM]RIY15474.1 putative metal-dependent hydrolase [Deinococcus sp. RM]
MTLIDRYPVGAAPLVTDCTLAQRRHGVTALRALPEELERAVNGLTEAQLDTPYRSGGWTLRQVVHHLADSHLNAYQRTKLTMTDIEPVVTPWDERAWATLPDSTLPIQASLSLLAALHERWATLFASMEDADWTRCFVHPQLTRQQDGPVAHWSRAFNADPAGRVNLDQLLALYVWHGQHHTAHILNLRRRRRW